MTDESSAGAKGTGAMETGAAGASGSGAPRRGGGSAMAALMLAGMFVLGGVAGVAVGRISALHDLRRMVEGPPAEARVNFRLEAMRRHLDLSRDQVERARAVMIETDVERDRLVATCSPGLEELRKRADARLREILNDEQRKRFDEMHSHRGHGPGPWMPPPPPPDGPPP